MIKSNNILLESNTMDDEEIDKILIEIVQEFVKPENQKQLDHQKLASSIFYSFAIGVLNNDEFEDEKIYNLQYVIEWLQEKEDLLAGFNMRNDNDL